MPSGPWSTLFKRKDKKTLPLTLAAVPTKPTYENLPYGLKVLAEGVDPVLE
ncbi:MAG: hypothetical protein Q9187_002614 [Circinaria calcarea]